MGCRDNIYVYVCVYVYMYGAMPPALFWLLRIFLSRWRLDAAAGSRGLWYRAISDEKGHHHLAYAANARLKQSLNSSLIGSVGIQAFLLMIGCSRVTTRCLHQELCLLHTITCTKGEKAESRGQRESAAFRQREVVGAIPGHDGHEVCRFNQ